MLCTGNCAVQCKVCIVVCWMEGIVLDVQCIVQRSRVLGGAGVHAVVGAVYVRGEQHSVYPKHV